MFRLIYKSAARHEAEEMFRAPNLPAILESSRRRNGEHGISGVLVYTGTGFLQVLEGGQVEVLAVFERLLVDRRHRSVSVIEMGEAERRLFGTWSMGFLGASPEADARLEAALGPVSGLERDPVRRVELLRSTLLLLVDAPISLLWREGPI
ncbi:BLUF domain-containing protein [Methylobacterium radiodurans]|uniref:Blue light sensor protein n=1 Tax=Methylobacterium radiodurans TaxID=2202828 RepID=A0A2U8VXJ4_9HYPH|nr:BLUF domain-containing protein [Methylobacterium radiodurans]AWN37990.1 blue light sensor protein [Methylobacterium radiodurans]